MHETKLHVCCVYNDLKKKHNEVTLKTKYETLKEFDKNKPNKEVQFSSTFLEVHILLGTKQYRPLSVE